MFDPLYILQICHQFISKIMENGSLFSHLTSPFSSVVNHWNKFKNWQQAKEEALIGEFN